MEEFLFENFDNGLLSGIFVVLLIIAIIILVLALILYVFQGLALMELAKKANIPNPWLAFIPTANMYILGKLGFEVFAPVEKRNANLTWILLGCSIGGIVLSSTGLVSLLGLAVTVFSTWAYYYIFDKVNHDNGVLFTVLTAIFGIGGLILFFNRKRFTNIDIEPVLREEVNNNSQNVKQHYCIYCGNQLNDNSKFCSKCGNKI